MTNLKQITFTIILLWMLGCSKTDEPKTDENERDDSQPTATEKVKYQLTFARIYSIDMYNDCGDPAQYDHLLFIYGTGSVFVFNFLEVFQEKSCGGGCHRQAV